MYVEFNKLQQLKRSQRLTRTNEVEKMFTYIRGFCADRTNPKTETARALGYVREIYKDRERYGEPSLIHPLSMVVMSIQIGMVDDVSLAVDLYHDVPDDLGLQVVELPASKEVRHGVELVAQKRIYPGEDACLVEKKYYRDLLSDPNAVIAKSLSRYSKTSSMVGAFTEERVMRTVRDTHENILPLIREAQQVYPIYGNELSVLECMLRDLNDTIALMHGMDLYEPKT